MRPFAGDRIVRPSSPGAEDPTRPRTLAAPARAVGALALGAFALGAFAIGAFAIGRLAIGRARIRRLEIDELTVQRLRVTDDLQVPPQPRSEARG